MAHADQGAVPSPAFESCPEPGRPPPEQWTSALSQSAFDGSMMLVRVGGETQKAAAVPDDEDMQRLIVPAMASGLFSGSEQPEIVVGPGVVLRPWRLDDAGAVVEAFADSEFQRWHVLSAESVDGRR